MTTRRVSYQAILAATEAAPAEATVFVPLGEDALATRRRDASKPVRVTLSKAQLDWLRRVEKQSGKGVDADAVLRTLVDVGRALDVDWSAVGSPAQLREAVRAAVRVRSGGAGAA